MPRTRHGFGATMAACAALLLAFGALAWSSTDGLERWTHESLRRAAAREGRLQAAPLALLRADGAAVEAFAGPPRTRPRIVLVDFIYTRCPSVCQALGAGFFQAQERLRREGRDDIALLSVSFDTAHDDVASLQAYARLHRADPAWWTIAVPASGEAARRVLRQLGIVVIPDGFGGYTHNAAIHLIDAQGRVRAIHALDDWPAAVAQAIRLADGEHREARR